ncbi:MAG: TapB family protein, partial [Ignavibacterium sp.]
TIHNVFTIDLNKADLFGKRNFISYKNYFPLNTNNVLVYNSDIGETELTIKYQSEFYISEFRGEDFLYRQKLKISNDGIFVDETYQKIKVLLFINKESRFNYDKFLPRIKYPFIVGQSWHWEGYEFNEEEKYSLKVKSVVDEKNIVTVPAGKFEAIKVITTIESSSGTKNTVTEWYAEDIGIVKMNIKIEGGGLMGILKDVLGYGELNFELKEIVRKQ